MTRHARYEMETIFIEISMKGKGSHRLALEIVEICQLFTISRFWHPQ